MIGCRMVFGMIVVQVGWSGTPKHMKLDLPQTIFKPAGTYVYGFGAFLMDCFIGDATRGVFVGLERGCLLRVAHFLQEMATGDSGL